MSPSVVYPMCDTYFDFRQRSAEQGGTSGFTFTYPHYPSHIQPHSPYSTNFLLHHNNNNHHHHHHHHHLPHSMAAPDPYDMDDFQRLSDNYRADLPGPLIGEKLPMTVLATEYAQADPTYVAKTAALAHNYSGYRAVKGDGQCGWRATVFGYFETLLQLGDIEMVEQERVRLQSFEQTMKMVGIDYDILVEMFDFTWELFDDLQKAVERQDKDDAVLLDVLNDTNRSDSIVYHFKMMTSAYMQLRAEQYEPFLEMPLGNYRAARIDPANQEIDQIGLQALTDAVIAPANFALEVLYLDRSVGESVTPHPFVADYMNKPTIRLLYRPGHYDIIYKGASPMTVYLQHTSLVPQDMELSDPSGISGDLQAYLFSGPEAAQSHSENSSFYSTMDHHHDHHHTTTTQDPTTTLTTNQYLFSPHPHPPSHILPPLSQYDLQQTHTMPLLGMDFHHQHHSSSSSSSTTSGSHTYPLQYSSPSSTAEISLSASPHATTPIISCQPAPLKILAEPQIRLNANCFNYSARHESMPLCAQNYGSAATLSTAHFRNQDFQPQMWRAEEEYLKP